MKTKEMENPFGATIIIDKDKNKKLSALNAVAEEGSWSDWKEVFAPKTTKRNLLVVETHNSYVAEAYENIFRYALGSRYEVEERTRAFKSHEGEKDIQIYSRFKARVTESEEACIRDRINKMKYPTYFIYGGGKD